MNLNKFKLPPDRFMVGGGELKIRFNFIFERTMFLCPNASHTDIPMLRVFIDFIFCLFVFLAALLGLQDLSSPTRDRALALRSESSES